jgi:hypothetical protein
MFTSGVAMQSAPPRRPRAHQQHRADNPSPQPPIPSRHAPHEFCHTPKKQRALQIKSPASSANPSCHNSMPANHKRKSERFPKPRVLSQIPYVARNPRCDKSEINPPRVATAPPAHRWSTNLVRLRLRRFPLSAFRLPGVRRFVPRNSLASSLKPQASFRPVAFPKPPKHNATAGIPFCDTT